MKEHRDNDPLIEGPLSASNIDSGEWQKLTESARLRSLRMIKSAFSVKPEVYKEEENLDKMTFQGNPVGFEFHESSNSMIGFYRWSAEIKMGKKKVLKFEADYILQYSGVQDFEEAYVEFYFRKVGRFTSYPYFRSDFSHNCCSAGLFLPPLPSLNERVN
ncbi:hypothetical protein OE810_05250 [Rhodobacteraceae bacterium XHP0102]|nr:hypothetical protein [Rhodobacteraceae bacterium XHP0102]